MSYPISPREQRFVERFLASGNATRAAREAGYSPKSARQQASRLLTKAAIQKAIRTRVDRRADASIMDLDERDRVLSTVGRNEREDTKHRIRAICELNKCSGRHSVQVNLKGKLTLEEAITLSRQVPAATD